MKSVIAPAAARSLLVVDALEAASLTEIARVTGSSLSTVQRAVSSLVAADVLRREWNRGPYAFAPGAPRTALIDIARWTLGRDAAARLVRAAEFAKGEPDAPSTIDNPRIRRAWQPAIERLVSRHRPRQIVLFGSQARGEARIDSDVDLLFVFDEVNDKRQKRVQIRKTLADMPFAKDVLVASRSELTRPAPGSALADAVRHGVTVYER